jgi:hypothetical protein
MSLAFLSGRTDKDPTENWYQREIEFFDCYVIPLANKLKDCGVFGVSSDEYLNYALTNRKEWESVGREVVADMSERCKSEHIANMMQQREGMPAPILLSYVISDQFGPEGLFTTHEWSRATPAASALGPRPDSPDDDFV